MNIFIECSKKKKYIDVFKTNKKNIQYKVFQEINRLIHHDKNIFNQKIKLINKLSYDNLPLYIGFICKYIHQYFILELYFFTDEPMITIDGQFYVHQYSVIEKTQHYLEVHHSTLNESIQKLFGITFEKIINDIHNKE